MRGPHRRRQQAPRRIPVAFDGAFGQAFQLTDGGKARALDAMIDRFYPGRAAEMRPTTAQEVKATTVMVETPGAPR